MRPFFSVVIPAYNESANLRAGKLDRIAEYLRTQNFTVNLLKDSWRGLRDLVSIRVADLRGAYADGEKA